MPSAPLPKTKAAKNCENCENAGNFCAGGVNKNDDMRNPLRNATRWQKFESKNSCIR